MEKRKTLQSKSSSLPADYLLMVSGVFTTHFEAGLKIYQEHRPESQFIASGEVFSDEIVVAVSLVSKDHLSATTVYASSDFDPQASAPSVQELLSACVDAIGSVFGTFLAPPQSEIIAQIAGESLSNLENAPYDWTEMEADQRKIFVKLDKSNPEIDSMADEWLKKHDPHRKEEETSEQIETEKLFFTGPRKKED